MLLIDPLVLLPPDYPFENTTSSIKFWNKILDWAGDKRVWIGEVTQKLVCEEYAKYGYPEHSFNMDGMPAGREYQSALNIILSRVYRHVRESDDISFSINYEGNSEQFLAFQMDISGTAGAGFQGLATDISHWKTDDKMVISFDPPPPETLEFCTIPGAKIQAEEEELVRTFLSGKRIHIVGGQRDQKIISNICAHLGVSEDDVDWLACEKAKPPRNLDKKWKMLDGLRDITICITGRVGHATSKNASRAAERADAPHLLVELPSAIEKTLFQYAVNNG